MDLPDLPGALHLLPKMRRRCSSRSSIQLDQHLLLLLLLASRQDFHVREASGTEMFTLWRSRLVLDKIFSRSQRSREASEPDMLTLCRSRENCATTPSGSGASNACVDAQNAWVSFETIHLDAQNACVDALNAHVQLLEQLLEQKRARDFSKRHAPLHPIESLY